MIASGRGNVRGFRADRQPGDGRVAPGRRVSAAGPCVMADKLDDRDPLRPARGLVIGLLIGAASWIAIMLVVLLLLWR